MFFGLLAVNDHPCCRMQDVVETFFRNSIEINTFSLSLFPEWMRSTLRNRNCTLGDKFATVHALLHGNEIDLAARQKIYTLLQLTNRIEELCNGTERIPDNVIDWGSTLGRAISVLMSALYDSLDLAVFRRTGEGGNPTHQFYREFIEKNRYVCPFCGLEKFKNRRGPRREDFDHYLHKSYYPLAAANMRNLVPTCGTCNQDYKKANNIMADGSAFFPYAEIPEIRLEIDCTAYPVTGNFADAGNWLVKLELIEADPSVESKINTWNRVYSIKNRLQREIQEYFEEWMTEVTDSCNQPVDKQGFVRLITSAQVRAKESAKRRMEPKQILKEAFYEFMLTKARSTFVESFRMAFTKAILS